MTVQEKTRHLDRGVPYWFMQASSKVIFQLGREASIERREAQRFLSGAVERRYVGGAMRRWRYCLLALTALGCLSESRDAKSPRAAVSQYAATVPPPALRATVDQPPELEVSLNTNGSLTVRRNGTDLGTVSSPSELATLVPRCTSDRRAILMLAPTAAYGAITGAMDELYALDCSEISFSMLR